MQVICININNGLVHSQQPREIAMIRIITTGGTIDGVGCSGDGCNCKAKPSPTQTRVPQLLSEARVLSGVEVTELFIKNSSKFTDEDRKQVLEACLQASETQIVVTHGTQTMCQTARFIAQEQSLKAKTVILTGAMKSTLEEGSDGSFNLGFALAAARCLPVGVYVAMHGHVFEYYNVRLTTNPKRFVKIFE